jgi:hypothetical protein
MKNVRQLTWCSGAVGLLGVALVLFGLRMETVPNGWLYIGVMLWVAACIALVCLFVIGLLDSLDAAVRRVVTR